MHLILRIEKTNLNADLKKAKLESLNEDILITCPLEGEENRKIYKNIWMHENNHNDVTTAFGIKISKMIELSAVMNVM